MPTSDLAQRQLVLVTGKGGVGKSAVAALLGRRFAAAGRRVLVMEVDPRESIHQILGVAPSGGEVTPAGERLSIQHVRARSVADRVVEEHLKIGPLVRRVQRSPVYRQFVEGAPGLAELAILEHARHMTRGRMAGGFDTVVVDAPATGHGVALLEAPRVVAEAVGDGPVGRLAGEVADFLADPSASAVVAVALAEEMPVAEVLELAARLGEGFGRRPDLLVVNGLYPPHPEEDADTVGGLEDAAPPPPAGVPPALDRLWRTRRRMNRRELARLEREWPGGPTVELPLVALGRGPELLAALALHLDREEAA